MPTNPFETSNPFAVTVPGTPSSAAATPPGNAPTSYATASGYDARQAGSQGYNAAQAGSQGYNASTAENERATATLRTVQDNELVQRQLEQIIGNDSPLIQRARQRATESMNARGLVNSSMALGAADAAMYDYAMPIAQADAGTFSGAARDNQAVQNSTSQFNAGESNTTARQNAGLISRASEFGADASNKASMFNTGETNNASQFTADAANRVGMFNVGEGNTASRTNAELATRVSTSNADAANRSSLQSNDQQFRASQAFADAQNAAARQTNDQAFRAAVANSDAQTRAALTVMENEFSAQRQGSAAASEVFRQYQTSATQIMTSDLPEGSKQQAINSLLQMTRQSMIATGAMDRLQIDEILMTPDLASPLSASKPSRTSDGTATPGGAAASTPNGTAPAESGADWWRSLGGNAAA